MKMMRSYYLEKVEDWVEGLVVEAALVEAVD